jgi:hypothetical protein
MRKALTALGIYTVIFPVLAGTMMLIPVLAAPARAQTMPPTDSSYYVAPRDTAVRAQRLGCDQAEFDNSRDHNSFVTLDFGAQRKDGKGTYLPGSTVFWPKSRDQNYALHFAYGYQSCGPRHLLIVGIGTSNDGAVTDGALGADWGSTVAIVAREASADGYSNIAVQGAIDAEPGFGPFPHFEGWEWGDKSGTGYVSRTKALLNDYGSADGCPQALGKYGDARCGSGWTIADEYNAVWGWSPNEATPEIYFDGCHGYANMANQWARVSDYGKHYGGQGTVRFVAPLDQRNCLNAAQAWSAFRHALTADGVPEAMNFSTQIVTG